MKSPQNHTNAAGAVVQKRIIRRLLEARENIRWTQADLAKATGLQPAAISHFECGQRLPSLPNAVKLADALRVSLDWLTGRNDGVPRRVPRRNYQANPEMINDQILHQLRARIPSNVFVVVEARLKDSKRLDWLEREGHQIVWDDVYPGVARASDGKSYYAPTLRKAIDLAISSENAELTPPDPKPQDHE